MAPLLVKTTAEVRRKNNAEQSLPLIGGITRNSRAKTTFLHIIANSRLLTVLKADKKAVFTAASKASEAAAFLAALQDA